MAYYIVGCNRCHLAVQLNSPAPKTVSPNRCTKSKSRLRF